MATAILEGFLQHLDSMGLSPMPPIAWPGINFNPPETGLWLEAKYFPNENEDPHWQNEACYNARGFFQVLVGFRPGLGQIQASTMADDIAEHFKKGTNIGPVRVMKAPSQSPVITDSDKLFIPVTIPYSGLVK